MDLYKSFSEQARFGPLCILPFNQLVIDANGDCYPCEALRGQQEYNLGNIYSNNFQDIWNGELIKSFRLRMLNKKRTLSCDMACHEDYETSCKSLNPINFFPKFINNIDKINFDGTVSFLPSTFFLKTSNICNLACQYCKEESSTTWSLTKNKVFHKNYQIEKKDSITEKLCEIIVENSDDLECLYFSGGEPSLVPSYSKMLKYILDKKGSNLKVAAASNISQLNDTSKTFFNLLNQFRDAMVFCSLDSHNEINDYIRMFSSFNKSKETFSYIKSNLPNIKIHINSVISIFNALSIFDFHKEWYDEGLVEIDSFRYVLCQFPKIFNILYLSDDTKEKIIEYFINYINWLKINENNNNDYPNNGIRNYIYLKKYVVDLLTLKYPEKQDFLDIRKKQKEYLEKISLSKITLPKSLDFIKDDFLRPVIRYNKDLIYLTK